MQPVWAAFWDLHEARFGPWGMEAIRFAEIAAWLDVSGISGSDLRSKWAGCIRGMDRFMHQWFQEQKAKDE